MLEDRQTKLLEEEVCNVIAILPEGEKVVLLVKEAMKKAHHNQPWAVLPLKVCEAINGNFQQALPAAAAFQFFRVAAETFDDVEDEDKQDSVLSRHGYGIATNLATTLLFLGELSILRLAKRNVAHHVVVETTATINSAFLKACVGQHQDLSESATSPATISEETYLSIAYSKSATFLECACVVGALLAGVDGDLGRIFSSFGYNLGMMSQLANDIHGTVVGTDLIQRKITLPMIFLLNNNNDFVLNGLTDNNQRQLDISKLKEKLFETGAIHYSLAKMESFKERALADLYEAKGFGVDISSLVEYVQ